MAEYYLQNGKEKEGPFDLDQLGKKSINPLSLVWSKDQPDWIEACKIPELASIINTPPPVGKKGWFGTNKTNANTSNSIVDYECKNCRVIKASVRRPDEANCPKGGSHVWADKNRRTIELTILSIARWFFMVTSIVLGWIGIMPVIESDFKVFNTYLGLSIGFFCGAAFLWWRYLKRKTHDDGKPDYTHALITIVVGVIMLMASLYLLIYFHHVDMDKRPTLSTVLWLSNLLLRDLAIAVILAGIVAWLLEIKNFMTLVTKAVTSSLTSDDYLEKLSEDRLYALKKSCSRKITETGKNRNEPNLNESLIDLEAEISKEIFSPYYEKFRIRLECIERGPDEMKIPVRPGETATVKCFTTLKGNLLEQRIRTKYTIINPKQGQEIEKVRGSYNLAQPVGVLTEEISHLIRLEKFEYTVDNEKKVNRPLDSLKYKVEKKVSQQVIKYDVSAVLLNADDSEVSITYNDKLVVEIIQVVYVPMDDWTYSRRLTKPAKTSSVFYQYTPPPGRKIKFQAECFCTLQKYYQDAVTINDGSDYVEILCDNWLLPANGFFITHMPEDVNTTQPLPPAEGDHKTLQNDNLDTQDKPK